MKVIQMIDGSGLFVATMQRDGLEFRGESPVSAGVAIAACEAEYRSLLKRHVDAELTVVADAERQKAEIHALQDMLEVLASHDPPWPEDHVLAGLDLAASRKLYPCT